VPEHWEGEPIKGKDKGDIKVSGYSHDREKLIQPGQGSQEKFTKKATIPPDEGGGWVKNASRKKKRLRELVGEQ